MSPNTLPEAAASRISKRTTFAPRVAQTLGLLLEGGSEKEVAQQLGISRNTVHVYVQSLYRHFGVSSRAELMALVLRTILKSSVRSKLLSLIEGEEEDSHPNEHAPVVERLLR